MKGWLKVLVVVVVARPYVGFRETSKTVSSWREYSIPGVSVMCFYLFVFHVYPYRCYQGIPDLLCHTASLVRCPSRSMSSPAYPRPHSGLSRQVIVPVLCCAVLCCVVLCCVMWQGRAVIWVILWCFPVSTLGIILLWHWSSLPGQYLASLKHSSHDISDLQGGWQLTGPFIFILMLSLASFSLSHIKSKKIHLKHSGNMIGSVMTGRKTNSIVLGCDGHGGSNVKNLIYEQCLS